jgi:hypothetical protein
MLNPIRNAACLFAFAFVFAISGCGNKHEITEPATSSAGRRVEKAALSDLDTLIAEEAKFIQPLEGGTFALGACSFEIPPGALSLPALITAELRDALPPPGLKDAPRRVFRFFPAGLQFQRSAILYVSFDALGIDDRSAYGFRCYYYNAATQQHEAAKTRVDFAGRRYIVFLQHFSMYTFGR